MYYHQIIFKVIIVEKLHTVLIVHGSARKIPDEFEDFYNNFQSNVDGIASKTFFSNFNW